VGPGLPLGAAGTPVFSLTRYLGSAGYFGDSQKGPRETETFRFGVGLDGSLFNDAINYSFAVNVSQRVRDTTGTDMPVENMAFALDGLGGPNCNQATGTPGVGGCQFFNPFSNAFEFSARTGLNPNFNPAVANSPEMIDWLFEPIDSRTTNRLITWDLVFSGSAGLDFGGGDIDWAAGMQVRREFYELELGDNINPGRVRQLRVAHRHLRVRLGHRRGGEQPHDLRHVRRGARALQRRLRHAARGAFRGLRR
jgi:iron complex outermembrane receptor protein